MEKAVFTYVAVREKHTVWPFELGLSRAEVVEASERLVKSHAGLRSSGRTPPTLRYGNLGTPDGERVLEEEGHAGGHDRISL